LYTRIRYNNRNKLLLGTVLKCASTSALQIAYYPLLGRFDKGPIQKRDKEFASLMKKIIPDSEEWNSYPVRIAIVRNPIDRLFSCYVNKYLNKTNTEYRRKNSHIRNYQSFVTNLDYIRSQLPIIAHHSRPIFKVLGPAKYFTHIIDSKNINTELVPLIKKISGNKDVPSFHLNSSFASNKKSDTKIKKVLPLIKKYYKEDYDEYGSYFI